MSGNIIAVIGLAVVILVMIALLYSLREKKGGAPPPAHGGHEDDHAHPPAPAKEKGGFMAGTKSFLWLVAGILFIVILGGWASMAVLGTGSALKQFKNDMQNTPAVSYAPVQTQPIKIDGPKGAYRFRGEECLTIRLQGNWTSYPLGGVVEIKSMETGRVIARDDPSKEINASIADGWYLVCKGSPKTWGYNIEPK